MQLGSSTLTAILLSGSLLEAIKVGQNTLHCVTVEPFVRESLIPLLATSDDLGIHCVVLNLLHPEPWPVFFGALSRIQEFVFKNTDADDLVLYVDRDVVFQAGAEELVAKYLDYEASTGHELVYNADTACTEPCLEEQPADARWRFLNSGIFMGRARALRSILTSNASVYEQQVLSAGNSQRNVQYWHVLQYMARRDMIGVDFDCQLFQVVFTIDNLGVQRGFDPSGLAMDPEAGCVVNYVKHAHPAVLHFPGRGHWPDYGHPTRLCTCVLYEYLLVSRHHVLVEKWQDAFYKGLTTSQPWRIACDNDQMLIWDGVLNMVQRRIQDLILAGVSVIGFGPAGYLPLIVIVTCLLVVFLAGVRMAPHVEKLSTRTAREVGRLCMRLGHRPWRKYVRPADLQDHELDKFT